MEMSYDEYIQNPMGRKSAVFSHREMYRKLYKEKLDKILVREMGKIKYTLYFTDEIYYLYINIPSEVVPNFYYDTVIMFYPSKPEDKFTTTLKDYKIKFYSNDPSFVFTFAHSMIKNNLFIDDLRTRMSKEAIKKEAVIKNPDNQIGYVKSLYFAYLIMVRDSLFEKIKFKTYGEKYSKNNLLYKVMNADEKVALREKKGKEVQLKNKKEKTQSKELIRKDADPNIITQNVSKVASFASKAKVIKSSTVKKAKVIKKK